VDLPAGKQKLLPRSPGRKQPYLWLRCRICGAHRTLHRSISTHSTKKVSPRMISPEIRAQIRRYFYAEHWKVGTIASELGVHPDAVRNAIESERFNRTSRCVHPSSIPTSSSFARLSINIRDCAPRASTR
jgi:hypothetical protein